MKKTAARYASAVLATCATFFVAIFKPLLYSPEIPEELK